MPVSSPYKKPLGVGQVASICRVSKKTVLNWIYEGALKAFTTYGGHYRIWPVNLKRFLDASGMDIPFDYVDETVTNVLVMDEEKSYAQMLKSVISADIPGTDVTATDDLYEGLLSIGERRPHLVILNPRLPGADAAHLLGLLRKRKAEYGMKILVVTKNSNAEAKEQLLRDAADAVLDRSADVDVLVKTVEGLVRSDVGLLHEVLVR
jgi:excisionase family DNA binding protein